MQDMDRRVSECDRMNPSYKGFDGKAFREWSTFTGRVSLTMWITSSRSTWQFRLQVATLHCQQHIWQEKQTHGYTKSSSSTTSDKIALFH
jgi:hypothetical protein